MPPEVKALAEVGGMVTAAVTGIFAAGTDTAITVSAIGAVFVFAGLLVRMIVQNQQSVWRIVQEKDREIVSLRHDLAYSEWERQMLRYTYGERPTAPGPPPVRESREVGS